MSRRSHYDTNLIMLFTANSIHHNAGGRAGGQRQIQGLEPRLQCSLAHLAGMDNLPAHACGFGAMVAFDVVAGE